MSDWESSWVDLGARNRPITCQDSPGGTQDVPRGSQDGYFFVFLFTRGVKCSHWASRQAWFWEQNALMFHKGILDFQKLPINLKAADTCNQIHIRRLTKTSICKYIYCNPNLRIPTCFILQCFTWTRNQQQNTDIVWQLKTIKIPRHMRKPWQSIVWPAQYSIK